MIPAAMRIVGVLVMALGLAGALAFSKPDLRWESAGAGVVGFVLLVSARRAPPS